MLLQQKRDEIGPDSRPRLRPAVVPRTNKVTVALASRPLSRRRGLIEVPLAVRPTFSKTLLVVVRICHKLTLGLNSALVAVPAVPERPSVSLYIASLTARPIAVVVVTVLVRPGPAAALLVPSPKRPLLRTCPVRRERRLNALVIFGTGRVSLRLSNKEAVTLTPVLTA